MSPRTKQKDSSGRASEAASQRRGGSRGSAKGRGSAEKLWSGRFRQPTHPMVEAFTASLGVDGRLAVYDIQGSIAHCRALCRAGVLASREAAAIIRGLESVRAEVEAGRFSALPEDEDIHTAIERRLTELIGPVGGKLHTGRSRNDQVVLDLRLYLRDHLGELIESLRRFQLALLEKAQEHLDVVMPGYTHLQRAQPVLLSHHLLAYVEMVNRDRARLQEVLARINVLPLGSGALAGSNFPIDRNYVARMLGFSQVTENSLDAVSDRDFAIESLAAISLIMMHLSRLSEELVLWSSQEFQFVDLPDEFCTGSSMMPQKKNPDVPELVRGKAGRVYGHLMALLTTMKGLPLSYNRDLQEDKPPLFDGVDTVRQAVEILTALLPGLKVNRLVVAKAAESDTMLATELADYLARKGAPFREAHRTVGQLVRHCQDRQRKLGDLTLEDLRGFSDQFDKEALDVLTLEGAIERKAQIGGTARKQVEKRIRAFKRALA